MAGRLRRPGRSPRSDIEALILEETAQHVTALLDLLEADPGASAPEAPPAALDIARLYARQGIPVSRLDETGTGPQQALTQRRVAQRSVLDDRPESPLRVGGTHSYPDDSEPVRALTTGRSVLHHIAGTEMPSRVARHRTSAPFDDEGGGVHRQRPPVHP
ncbi:hypothetical protein [Streptomyces sp. KL118A]|uniref:hypothetical protein n=1 Tax=Streptomyces sp. KL118A TaxID=3045153 RepID=UPI00278BE6B1|nr:hypothetical protein [Streptomyces sp. KL118A]